MIEKLRNCLLIFGEQVGSVLYLNKENNIHEMHFQLTSDECLFYECLTINHRIKTIMIKYSLEQSQEKILVTKTIRNEGKPGIKSKTLQIDHDKYLELMIKKIYQPLYHN